MRWKQNEWVPHLHFWLTTTLKDNHWLPTLSQGTNQWVHHYTPELKVHSMAWTVPDERAPNKAKWTRSLGSIGTHMKFCWFNIGRKVLRWLGTSTEAPSENYNVQLFVKSDRGSAIKKSIFCMAMPVHFGSTLSMPCWATFCWKVFDHLPSVTFCLPKVEKIRGLSQKSSLLFFVKSKNDARKTPCRGNLIFECRNTLIFSPVLSNALTRTAVSQRWSYQYIAGPS